MSTLRFERAHYRIEYPERERPWLALAEGRTPQWRPVVDVCERGLRFIAFEAERMPALGTMLSGRLRFGGDDEEEVEVAGRVVRVQERDVAVQLEAPGIPLRIILREQRRLLRLYPARFHPAEEERSGRRVLDEGEELPAPRKGER